MTLLNTISNLAYAASRAVLLFVLDWISFSNCLVTQDHSNVTTAAPEAELTGGSLFSCCTKTMRQVPVRVSLRALFLIFASLFHDYACI